MPVMQNPLWVTQRQAASLSPPPQIESITVFPDPVPHGATATIYISATQSGSSMEFALAADSGPAPQPTADPSIWTWTAP